MAIVTQKDIQRGYGLKDRPVCKELWDNDSFGSVPLMVEDGDYEPDNRHIDYRHYYDPAFAKAEMEHIWKKQWLYAGREEDIPEVGDRMPFKVGELSFIIVRTEADQFKAYYNSCLHRGTELCTKKESGSAIRCPYHGWEWRLDGRLKKIPSHWDFTEMTPVNASLPQVKLDRWGGFIFINCDPDCLPLTDALGPMPRHFEAFAPQDRYTKMRFRKLIAANWKVVQEAFQESYHLYATHPEGVPFTGDSQSKYDIYRTPMGGIGRESVPSGVPSAHADASATTFEAARVMAEVVGAWHYPDSEPLQLDPDKDPRSQVAAWHRKVYQETYGRENNQPDAVMLDSVLYFAFPHFCIWLSEATPMVYQFTPHATDPEKSYFEVRVMLPYPEGQPRPPSAETSVIDIDQTITEGAPDFKFLAMIFDQDMANMPRVQRGTHASAPSYGATRLGIYQEMILQFWHETIAKIVGDDWKSATKG